MEYHPHIHFAVEVTEKRTFRSFAVTVGQLIYIYNNDIYIYIYIYVSLMTIKKA